MYDDTVPRVLVLAYAFPPDLAMGTQRPWGLYRHLRTHGWEPVILTASAGSDLPNVIRILHRGSSERLRSILGLRRDALGLVPNALRTARRLLTAVTANPEVESGWREPAFAAGLNQLANGAFDAILSTSPPTTMHLIARDLKKRTGLPWVADLRDLWADNYAYPWSELRRAVDRRIEHRVLQDADAILSVSEPLAQVLRSHHPPRASSILNGFPPEEAAGLDYPLSRHFTITYTGTLYPGKRNPEPLFEALAGLVVRDAIDPKMLELRLYGRNIDQPSLRAAFAAHGLGQNVVLGGLLPRDEVLQRQRESQILLALDWMDERQPGVYTGKIFEYLAAQRPILCIGPPGSVVDTLLRETGAGHQCSTVPQVQDFLLESYQEFKGSGRVTYHGDRTIIQRYDHNSMSRQFAEVLSRIIA